MHTASIWGEGKFCLDREFSKNAPYKQKIIFHLVSSDKMPQKIFFLLGRWISGTVQVRKLVDRELQEPLFDVFLWVV